MKKLTEDEKRIVMEEIKWRIFKKEFDELQTYPEKLLWWETNVPEPIQNHTDPNDPNHRIITNNYPIQFQYSGIGAPQVENFVASVFYYNEDHVSVNTQETKEFISILPIPFNSEQQKQFWDWFTQKIELKSLEDWIEYYKNELNIDSVFQPEIIEKLKHNLKTKFDNNLRNGFFEMGRNYAIHTKAEYLKIGDPDWDYTTISKNIKDIMQGYELALKETALNKVIKNLNNEIVEPDEFIPDEIQQRICWLYAIGVIDNFKEQHKIQSHSTIGSILSIGLDLKKNTIKQTLERIEKEDLLKKFDNYINQMCSKHRIIRVK